jgi:hypothetical protein
LMVVTASEVSFRTLVGSGWSFEARSEAPGKPAIVQVWPEVFWNARSAATWPAPWLSGITFQVPEGISAVVHAPPAACAGADVDACDGGVEAPPEVVPPADVDDEAVTAPGFAADPDEDVLATGVELPGVDAPLPALFEALLEQPAVRAAVPSAPTANKTEIRFMEPNLPG